MNWVPWCLIGWPVIHDILGNVRSWKERVWCLAVAARVGTWMWWAGMDGILEGLLFYPFHSLKVFLWNNDQRLWTVPPPNLVSNPLAESIFRKHISTPDSRPTHLTSLTMFKFYFIIAMLVWHSNISSIFKSKILLQNDQHYNILGCDSILCSLESGSFCCCLKRLVRSAVLSTFSSLSSLNSNTTGEEFLKTKQIHFEAEKYTFHV